MKTSRLETNKRLSVSRRKVLYVVAQTNGVASSRVHLRTGIPPATVTNALQFLRKFGLVEPLRHGMWIATQQGKDWFENMKALECQ